MPPRSPRTFHAPGFFAVTAVCGAWLSIAAIYPASGQQAVPAFTPVDARARPGPAVQPASLPDAMPTDQPELPPIGQVRLANKHHPFLYGLYAWDSEYFKHHEAIRQVGWRSFRLGGKIDDDTMRRLVADDVEIVHTVGAGTKPDADPAGDDAFIREGTEKLAAFARRYGPGGTFFKEHPDLPDRPIKYLEIANEPNFQYFIKPDKRPGMEQEAGREALYAKYLPAAYAAARAANPQVQIVGFSTGGAGAGDMRFVEHVLALNPAAAKSFDIFATHPYVAPAPPECYSHRAWGKYSVASALATLRKTLAAHGRGEEPVQAQMIPPKGYRAVGPWSVPVWYTEVGWEISHQDGGYYDKPAKDVVTPDLQAAYTCRLYALSLRLGVDRVTNMFCTDTDNYNGGFFLPNGGWRPSAYAVQTMIKLLPAPKLLEPISDGVDGYFAFRLLPGPEPGARPVVMLWNVSGPKTVSVPLEEKRVRVVDMYGHAHEADVPSDGLLPVDIGPLPVYVAPVGGQ